MMLKLSPNTTIIFAMCSEKIRHEQTDAERQNVVQFCVIQNKHRSHNENNHREDADYLTAF